MHALAFSRPAPDATTSALVDVAIPSPSAGQVSIDVAAAGVNFIDVMARRGDPGYVARWPFVPGLEVSGVIREIGASVAGLRPGQLVAAFTGSGGLADVVVTDARLVAAVPDSLKPTIAAAAPVVVATAVLLVEGAARVRPDDTLLVQSASGGVGQAVAAVARLRGATRLLGVVGSRERIRDALAAGYDAAFVRDEQLVTAVTDHLGGGVDAILETQGTRRLDDALALARPGARIVLIGNAGGEALAPLPEAKRLFAGNVSIGGFSISSLSHHAPEVVGAALRKALVLLDTRAVELDVKVHHGLAAAPAIHDQLGRGGSGKHVVAL
jgi:NADPH2:quinone reductase